MASPSCQGQRSGLYPFIPVWLEHSLHLQISLHGLDFLPFQALSCCCYLGLLNE